jgi:ribulose-phosphate 3-epimerase
MTQPTTIIAPSLLAANPAHYLSEIKDIEQGGAEWLHLDVMDGSFVPSITFGDNIVSMAKKGCGLFLDVHLMINRPENHLNQFKRAGADRIIVHQETCPHLHRVLGEIRSLGMANGVALNPGTPVESIFDVLEITDLVLIMTVNPGWGGQPFLPTTLRKISAVRDEITRRQLPTVIEVDGGITPETAPQCVQAGASVLVAGSSVFGKSDRKAAILALRS